MKIKILFLFLIIIITLFSGCSGKSDIKDNFCGVHIDFRYCKCAFHNEHCGAIGMSKSEAKKHVYAEYDKWRGKNYGIVEKNNKLYLNSKPGEVLSIKSEDLPEWAQGKIATVGAQIAVVGTPDTIIKGDSYVLLDGKPIARVGDSTAHGGSVVDGSDKIFVNGKPVAVIGSYAVDPSVNPGPVPSVGGPIVSN